MPVTPTGAPWPSWESVSVFGQWMRWKKYGESLWFCSRWNVSRMRSVLAFYCASNCYVRPFSFQNRYSSCTG